MSECSHTITMGRDGETGSWCVSCGIKVLEVHDRPCSECRHYRSTIGGLCSLHHMRVSANMNVTYYLVDGPGRHGLCFEPTAAPVDLSPVRQDVK